MTMTTGGRNREGKRPKQRDVGERQTRNRKAAIKNQSKTRSGRRHRHHHRHKPVDMSRTALAEPMLPRRCQSRGARVGDDSEKSGRPEKHSSGSIKQEISVWRRMPNGAKTRSRPCERRASAGARRKRPTARSNQRPTTTRASRSGKADRTGLAGEARKSEEEKEEGRRHCRQTRIVPKVRPARDEAATSGCSSEAVQKGTQEHKKALQRSKRLSWPWG